MLDFTVLQWLLFVVVCCIGGVLGSVLGWGIAYVIISLFLD